MSNKRPKKRSHVWEHFEETPDRKRATCRHCGSCLSAQSTGGTSHLKRHIEVCSRDRDPAPGNKVRKLAITDDKSWEVEVKRAVLAEIPFASSNCKKILYSLNCPMEMDIEKSIYAYYEREKEKLVTEFENLRSKVSFTIDIMKGAGYVSISAHFINDDFNLVHKLIGFKKIADSPPQTSIASTIQSCVSGWRLGEKIFMLTHKKKILKAGNFNVCSAQEAGFRFTQTCCKENSFLLYPYVSSLFYQEHAKIVVPSYKEGTINSKFDNLNRISKEQGLPSMNVDLYEACNASYRCNVLQCIKVLQCISLHKEVICQYAPNEGGLMHLSDIKWERVKLLLNAFKLVNNCTKEFSSFKNPTIHLHIQYLLKVRDSIFNTTGGSISHGLTKTDIEIKDGHFMDSIKDRFNKMHYTACVLDPRCKLVPFEYIEKIGRPEKKKEIREKVHGGLEELFGEYAKEETNHTSPLHIGTTSTTDTQHEDSTIDSAGHGQNANSFAMYMLQKQKIKPKTSELDKYLGEEVIEGTDEYFDLLAWWKENKSRYPVLSRMARDVLAVPATVYDVREHITKDLRRLGGVDPQLVEAVICCKDWIISSTQSD